MIFARPVSGTQSARVERAAPQAGRPRWLAAMRSVEQVEGMVGNCTLTRGGSLGRRAVTRGGCLDFAAHPGTCCLASRSGLPGRVAGAAEGLAGEDAGHLAVVDRQFTGDQNVLNSL